MYYFSYSTSSFAFSRLAALCHILFARSYSLQGILGLNMIMGSHPRISWSNMSFRDISSLRMYNMRIHKAPFEDLMAPWLSLSEGARLASFLRLATDLGGADLREELIWERADLREDLPELITVPTMASSLLYHAAKSKRRPNDDGVPTVVDGIVDRTRRYSTPPPCLGKVQPLQLEDVGFRCYPCLKSLPDLHLPKLWRNGSEGRSASMR